MKRPELALPRAAAGGLVLLGGVAAFALIRLWAAAPEAPPAPAPAAPAPLPPAPLPAAPPAPPPSAEGLRLFGLLGRGAVIADASGRQLFYGIGREVRPGLRVARVEQSHVVLASDGGEVRLGFDGAAQAAAAAGAAAADNSEAALRDETLRYRLGLAPRQVGGRTAGFVVRPGADLPALQRAGLRPGDVILGVNGSGFDEERMLELAWQIAHSDRTEFEVERGGRRIRLALQGQRD